MEQKNWFLFQSSRHFRWSWQIPDSLDDSNFRGLKVDIDRTDMGFAVGEVEAVFQSSGSLEDIDFKKEEIRKLVMILTSFGQNKDVRNEKKGNVLSMGKLEYYLQVNSKCHYDACVQAGVI